MTHTETIRAALRCADADLQGVLTRAQEGVEADKEDLRSVRCSRSDITMALNSLDRMVGRDDMVKTLKNILRLLDGVAGPDHGDPIGDGVESLRELVRKYEA